ncbi:UDP-glycosyltransferase 75C1-like [Salvia miltiorrhiza]|uniref:UDP-glycosyltransferase 75C1-like n=1 Tax=Salvia miltiorrhiza TaxID=226208 RepID=UPI0025ACDE52|nr:UDP-glycosyltransferase 75C1-like [Salvia miltiorrhiza]
MEPQMKQHHYLITCFPVQGHINPTLQLAKNLAALGATVTFATTAAGLKRVQDRLPAPHGLSYASFSEENVPAGDATAYMTNMRRCGSENLTKILQKSFNDGRPVTCLVYSLLMPWASAVARDMHVPSAFLVIQCAAAFVIYSRFFGGHGESSVSVSIQDLPTFSSCDLPTFVLPENPTNSFMGPMLIEHMQELETLPKSLVLLNTFQELEQEAIKELESKLNVIAIGPLISTNNSFGGDLSEESYLRWLDSKPEKSVVYIAFGSLVVMNKEQKIEILHGLVQSKRPFLWVVRSSDNEEEEVKKMVEDEMKNCDGMIVAWCLQTEVLSHKSIGCFVTHCGWNSTLEGLVCGVPLIGCPHFSDQTTNAKLVEEVWRNGVRARTNGEVVIKREELGKCLDVVMGEGERGKEIRKNARILRGMAMEAVKDGGSSYNNLRKVIESF